MLPSEQPGIAPYLRQIPTIGPEDTVSRALSMLRYAALDTLPVVDSAGRLQGVLTLDDLRPLLVRETIDLLDSVSEWARKPAVVAAPKTSLSQAREALIHGEETTLPVVDEYGRYLGVIGFADLIEPIPVRARPGMIGGMATPWGVYLTNGSLQAGVGNLALAGTGVLMGVLFIVAIVGVGLLLHRFDSGFAAAYFNSLYLPEPRTLTIESLPWVAARSLPLIAFLLMIRALPLSQYHAAEHQAVHAMERGEPLHPAVVDRMPRVHPRCGTNIMAAALIFTAGFQGFTMLSGGWLGTTDGALLAALLAALTWRRFGGFLQYYFTTRPAAAKHIASGLAAAEDLESKFQGSHVARPRILRRIWCMGLPQVMAGVTAGAFAAIWIVETLRSHFG
jgi:CBS domain-containing protein